MEENRLYDETVDVSRQHSLEKALLILEKEQQAYEQSRLQKLVRPSVSPIKGILVLLSIFIAYTLVFLISDRVINDCNVPFQTSIVILTIFVLALFIVKSKPISIYCIKLYQHYAPTRLRLSCVFEPSCSEYMIKAIDKYGAFKGIAKGIDRLFRCHPPNGGEDNP